MAYDETGKSINYTDLVTSGHTWDHHEPNITLSISATSGGTVSMTLGAGSSWTSDSKYGYTLSVYVGSSSSACMTWTGGDSTKSYSFTYTGTIDIYVLCSDTGCVNNVGSKTSVVQIIDNRYTAPSGYTVTITGRTGTTITATHSWTDGTDTITTKTLTCAGVTKTVSNGSSVTFNTNISNATSYTVSGSITDGTTTRTGSASTTTYGCSVSCSDETTNTIKLTFTSTGYSYSISSKGITYTVRQGSSSGTVVKSATNTTNTTVTITGLSPNTTYYVSVYLTDVTDATASNSTTTLVALTVGTATVTSTGKTITLNVPITRNSSTGTITLSATVNGTTKTATLSSSSSSGTLTITFTGLNQGTSYSYTFYATDGNSNTSTGTGGSVYTYSITITTGTFSSTATLKLDTKAIMFKAVIATGDSNKSSKTLNYSVSGGNASVSDSGISGSAGTAITVTNLDHNTTYTITYDVDGMTDATKTATMTTALLSLSNTEVTWKQSTVSSAWQAYATPSGGSAVSYDTTYINQTAITISSGNCSCVGSAESGYQTPETTPSLTDYAYKALAYALLTYYCAYVLTCAITDGHNIVTANVSGHTTFPYAYVYNGSAWKKAMPYIYNGSAWILAPEYTYNGSAWKVCNGD